MARRTKSRSSRSSFAALQRERFMETSKALIDMWGMAWVTGEPYVEVIEQIGVEVAVSVSRDGTPRFTFTDVQSKHRDSFYTLKLDEAAKTIADWSLNF